MQSHGRRHADIGQTEKPAEITLRPTAKSSREFAQHELALSESNYPPAEPGALRF